MRSPEEVIGRLERVNGGITLDSEVRERLIHDLNEGQAAFESMPGYRPERVCPKCNGTNIKTQYHDGNNPGCYTDSGGAEHLMRVCSGKQGCGYCWDEKCLSTEEFPTNEVPHRSGGLIDRLFARLFLTKRTW
jgi:hypothetical protein